MNTYISLAKFRSWPATVALLAVFSLISSAALAQRPSIAALQGQVGTLQSQVATLQTQVVRDMAGYVTMDISDHARPTLRVHGANLQVVNDLGGTGTVNGVGNVIVGYDETNAAMDAVCSLGQYIDQTTCVAGGGTWAVAHKGGSHNIVIGPNDHRYSAAGGLIAGSSNTVNGNYSSVSGGAGNTASATFASVSGGNSNIASGGWSSASGGFANHASGDLSSVSGGKLNTAAGDISSISGSGPFRALRGPS